MHTPFVNLLEKLLSNIYLVVEELLHIVRGMCPNSPPLVHTSFVSHIIKWQMLAL
jgi:hypothetical protein